MISIQDVVSKLGKLADVKMGIDPLTDVKVAKSPRYFMNWLITYVLVLSSICMSGV